MNQSQGTKTTALEAYASVDSQSDSYLRPQTVYLRKLQLGALNNNLPILVDLMVLRVQVLGNSIDLLSATSLLRF